MKGVKTIGFGREIRKLSSVSELGWMRQVQVHGVCLIQKCQVET